MWIFRFYLLSALFVLTACNTTSDSGQWTGTGTYSDDSGRVYPCNYIRIDINRTERFFDVNKVSLDCNPIFQSWGPASFDVYGETVYKSGQYIGWAKTDGSASFDVVEDYSSFRRHVAWNREADFLNYSEEVAVFGRRYIIRAVLKRGF